MIPAKQRTETTTGGTLGTRAMRVDASSLPHIMSVLTNLYKNPKQAVVREYITNAWDSHVAAGKEDVPLRIEVPTLTNPALTISDSGLGMSREDVENIFISYGASTKRESNDFTGQLGFGCKSAFAISDQFVVSAVKDGRQVVYSLHKSADSYGAATLMFEGDVDLPNGVSISIPIKREDFNSIISELTEFLYTFSGNVEVKPLAVESQLSQRYKDDIAFTSSSGKAFVMRGTSRKGVIMGNVLYPLPSMPSGVIIYAEIGEVNFVPSREALMEDIQTNNFISKELEALKYDIKKELIDPLLRIQDDEGQKLAVYKRKNNFNINALIVSPEWLKNRLEDVYGQITNEKTEVFKIFEGFSLISKPSKQHSGTSLRLQYVISKEVFQRNNIAVHDVGATFSRSGVTGKESFEISVDSLVNTCLFVRDFQTQDFSTKVKSAMREYLNASFGSFSTVRLITFDMPDKESVEVEDYKIFEFLSNLIRVACTDDYSDYIRKPNKIDGVVKLIKTYRLSQYHTRRARDKKLWVKCSELRELPSTHDKDGNIVEFIYVPLERLEESDLAEYVLRKRKNTLCTDERGLKKLKAQGYNFIHVDDVIKQEEAEAIRNNIVFNESNFTTNRANSFLTCLSLYPLEFDEQILTVLRNYVRNKKSAENYSQLKHVLTADSPLRNPPAEILALEERFPLLEYIPVDISHYYISGVDSVSRKVERISSSTLQAFEKMYNYFMKDKGV